MVVPDQNDLCSWWVHMTLSHIEDSATSHLRSHVARQVYVLCRNETVVVLLANALTSLECSLDS